MSRRHARVVGAVLLLGGCFVDQPPGTSGATASDTDGPTSGATADTADPASDGRGTSGPATNATSSTTAQDAGTSEGTEDTNGTNADEDTGASSDGPTPQDCRGGQHTVYLNFDGATLTNGIVDNAPNNVTSLSQQAGTWPAYGPDDAEEILDQVLLHWADYNICLTRLPPAAADFDMLVVQSEPYARQPNTVSLVPSDCGNAIANEVELLFLSDSLGLPVVSKAIAISKHIARRLGLDGVEATDDLMNRFVATTLNGATFTDSCLALHRQTTCTGTAPCNAGEQNARAHLADELGGL